MTETEALNIAKHIMEHKITDMNNPDYIITVLIPEQVVVIKEAISVINDLLIELSPLA